MTSTRNRVLLALVVIASILVFTAVVLSARESDETVGASLSSDPVLPPKVVNPGEARIQKQLRDAAEGNLPDISPDIAPDAKARCAEENSDSDRLNVKPAHARLYYRNYDGPEGAGGTDLNAAMGCLYETGRKTEFGFNDVVEGESFALVDGAGDFVAYSSTLWMADDGSDDGFYVWNLRTGKQMTYDEGCSGETFECSVEGVAVSKNGSWAYSACEESICTIYVKQAGDAKRKIAAEVEYEDNVPGSLLIDHDRLYWLDSDGEPDSTPFM